MPNVRCWSTARRARGGEAMALEALKAQIGLLLTDMEERPEDAHQLHEMIREKLNEYKATGMPLPDDLVELERRLEKQFVRDIKNR